MTGANISWVELLTLMVDGPRPEPTVRGIVLSDDGSDLGRHNVGFVVMAGQPPPVFAGAGRFAEQPDGTGSRPPLRVWRDGNRLRIEELDGQPVLIVGDEYCWEFSDGNPTPTRSPADAVRYSYGTQLLRRRDANDFVGDDFTRPTGPVEATTFLGRPAWTVELAPPSRKPFPLQLVVDAETGLVLQQRNDGFGSADEWSEFVVGEAMPDELFGWDGPSLDARTQEAAARAAGLAEHEADGRRRSAWFAANVAPLPLRLELTADVWVHEYDERTGAFQASLDKHGIGMLARRPLDSPGEWDLGWADRGHRWQDERWEWAVNFYEVTVGERGLAVLRDQLSGGPAAD